MRNPAILAASLVLVTGGAGAQRIERPVLAETFEGEGRISKILLSDSRMTLAPGEGVGGGTALRAAYVGGPMGSQRLVKHIPLGERGLEYTLTYDVKFDKDFQFVGGGKLHGLGPDRPVTGGEPMRPDGWSARVMWRAEGRPELYTYHQDQKGKYGEHGTPTRPFRFETGHWYAVSLHVRLNLARDRRDGAIRLYIDGELIEADDMLRLRGDEGAPISQFLFSTFHGGNDPGWAPKNPDGSYATVHALFDNFAVWRGGRVRKAPGSL